LLPAFIFSSLCIIVSSLLSRKPDNAIEKEFEVIAKGTY